MTSEDVPVHAYARVNTEPREQPGQAPEIYRPRRDWTRRKILFCFVCSIAFIYGGLALVMRSNLARRACPVLHSVNTKGEIGTLAGECGLIYLFCFF